MNELFRVIVYQTTGLSKLRTATKSQENSISFTAPIQVHTLSTFRCNRRILRDDVDKEASFPTIEK
jgi:hypothetical protein